MMKKIILAIIVSITVTALVSSCSPSRKTGCPTVNQQHGQIQTATI
jgi:hypothetical protein